MNTRTRPEALDQLEAALCSPRAHEELAALEASGALAELIPEITDLRMEILPTHRHKDVLVHTWKVVEQAVSFALAQGMQPSLTLTMAALLHDIAKPATRELHPDGSVTFQNHDSLGARMSRKRLRALGYEEEFIEDVCLLVELHLRTFGYAPGKWTDAGVRRYVLDAKHLLPELSVLVRADITTGNPRKRAELYAGLDDLEARITEVAERDRLASLRPVLDGTLVMERFQMTPGRELGRIMRALNRAAQEEMHLTEVEEWSLAEALRP